MSNIETQERVQQALMNGAATHVGLDPAELEILGVEDGVIRLKLNGWCAGCPSTVMAIIQSLENELRAQVPEVEYIEVAP